MLQEMFDVLKGKKLIMAYGARGDSTKGFTIKNFETIAQEG